MADVFCNNCGHKNPLGSNFCSSCGAVLETQPEEHTTITFHPVSPSDPVDEEMSITLEEIDGDWRSVDLVEDPGTEDAE